MKGQEDPSRCRITVTGDELVELKRHAHEIPDCPGLDRQIQKYDGKRPLVITRDELDWVVAVLDAVLHDPQGYPCVQCDPRKLEYVPRTDDRCKTCRRLYRRLRDESKRLHEISRKRRIKWEKQEQARERRKAKRHQADEALCRIEAVFKKRRCSAFPARASRGYTIYDADRALARIRQRDQWWEVLWWSHRARWEPIGELGGVVFGTVEEAAQYVLDDPMGAFWR